MPRAARPARHPAGGSGPGVQGYNNEESFRVCIQ